MVLTYAKYIDLMTALDEFSAGSLLKGELQNAIFDRYTSKYGNFVAENSIGNKALFVTKWQKTKINKAERKRFRNFMNTVSNNKKSKKNYVRLPKDSNSL